MYETWAGSSAAHLQAEASARGRVPTVGGRRAVILLSGGLDSSAAAAVAVRDGYEAHALSVDYGQRHRIELAAAARVAKQLGLARHVTVSVDLRAFGGSALTAAIPVPQARQPSGDAGIPPTYVPARNTVFLSLALAFAESIEASDIFLGVNATDYAGYPDCRPQFILAFEAVANAGTRMGASGRSVTIHTPLLRLHKPDIVRLALATGVDLALTSSCYAPAASGDPCGFCDACHLRRRGFAEAGAHDPLRYPEAAV